MLLREHWLNRASLACAILGILLLLVYSGIISPKELRIAHITEQDLDLLVRVQGRVVFSHLAGNVLIFALDDGATINCVFFNPGVEEKIILRSRNFVEIEGRTQMYKNELQIVAQKVTLLD